MREAALVKVMSEKELDDVTNGTLSEESKIRISRAANCSGLKRRPFTFWLFYVTMFGVVGIVYYITAVTSVVAHSDGAE